MNGYVIALIILVLTTGLPSVVTVRILLRLNARLDALTAVTHEEVRVVGEAGGRGSPATMGATHA